MNPWKVIESLNLGNNTNKLIRAVLKTDTIDTNLYIGNMNIIPQGDNNFEQLPWIPKKIENIQNQAEMLHNESISLTSISEYANKEQIESSKGLAAVAMCNIFEEKDENINGLIENITIALKDLQNAVNSIKYPAELSINTLFKIDTNRFEQVVNETHKAKNPSVLLKHISPYFKSPAHYAIFSISDDESLAFVLYGYKIAPKIGTCYHQIWSNIKNEPLMISNECIWRS